MSDLQSTLTEGGERPANEDLSKNPAQASRGADTEGRQHQMPD